MFDVLGIIIVAALVAGCAFLAMRAWKSKHGVVKWGGVAVTGLLTPLLAAVLIGGLFGFYRLNQGHDNLVVEVTVARTPEQIARGERLANACASCHSPGSQPPLSGTNFAAKFDFSMFGTLYAPNLTPGGDIDGWSDGEVIRAIREGVHKSGRSLLIMPSDQYRNLSDEDVQALVAYLRTQPGTPGVSPATRLNVLGALAANLFGFQTAQPPVGSVTAPQPGTQDYGKYMIDVIGCASCHGEGLRGKVDTGQPGPPAGPDLTQIVPQWTEAEFMEYFNTGTLPGGGTVPILTLPSGFSEPRMPWPMVRAVATDDELKAMYAYLRSLGTPAGAAVR